MKTEELFKYLNKRINEAQVEHNNFEPMYRDIGKYIRINQETLYQSQRGQDGTAHLFDNTATWANRLLASAMMAYLISMNDRWFSLGVSGYSLNELPDELRQWIEIAENRLYAQFAHPDSNFHGSMPEAAYDLTSYGTMVQNVRWDDDHLLFTTSSIVTTLIDTNYRGAVDFVAKFKDVLGRKILSEFPDLELHPDTEYRVYKITLEVKDIADLFDEGEISKSTKCITIETILDKKIILETYEYKEFPYIVARWSKKAGDSRGYSPAWDCIAAVRMINAQKKTLIRSAQKRVEPPYLVPHEGVQVPFSTDPGARILQLDGESRPVPLETGDPAITADLMRMEFDQISKSFHVDWVLQGATNVEKTALEISDKRQEQFLLLAPVINRQLSEWLGPLIFKSVMLLLDKGVIPPIPKFDGITIMPVFVSVAARSQQYLRYIAAGQWVDLISRMANLDPSVMDRVDLDMFAKDTSNYFNVSQEIIRSDKDVLAIRQARKQQQQQLMQLQQQQMQAETAETTAKAANYATQ